MKQRLDVALVERGLVETRTKAQALIMAGHVSADGRRLDKPGFVIDEGTVLHLRDQPKYVGRAGEKLASVADSLKLDFQGKKVVDVGSSTGGFTDYALSAGASKVFCVDVGTAQLAYRLRQDERTVVMEQTDIRDATLPELVDMAVIDVSFISLTKVLESVSKLLKPDGLIVAMAKPQFEAGKAIADRFHGVISDDAVRQEILDELKEWLVTRFEIIDEADSGLAGAQGNVEHFFALRKLR
jgi:23S rRNA (cytidine1920-2'-O)/16S rRNA (cytidine1409-2'-O)-methyltransferase